MEYTHGFSGFSVRDIDAAKAFYGETLGLETEVSGMGILTITLPGGSLVMVYPKEDHEPAVYTVLNLMVTDIDSAIDDLTAAGVTFERYEGMPQDARGVMRGSEHDMGPDIAWFLDPSGNIIGLLQE
ncbi:VOC family protein [Herbiconiux liukaitaii]|uniref:VOC family protein n=1 Tax=Herbiconiux liukaitaii TaxID=3342799 RepID=UPI0035BAE32B